MKKKRLVIYVNKGHVQLVNHNFDANDFDIIVLDTAFEDEEGFWDKVNEAKALPHCNVFDFSDRG